MGPLARLTFALTACALAAAAACQDRPHIDGTSVPTVGSADAPPACEPMCDRLGQLCGYPPTDCVTLCADYDDGHRACVGRAASCQEALESCKNEEVDAGEDAEPDAEPDAEAEAGDDAGDDAQDASDAAADG